MNWRSNNIVVNHFFLAMETEARSKMPSALCCCCCEEQTAKGNAPTHWVPSKTWGLTSPFFTGRKHGYLPRLRRWWRRQDRTVGKESYFLMLVTPKGHKTSKIHLFSGDFSVKF